MGVTESWSVVVPGQENLVKYGVGWFSNLAVRSLGWIPKEHTKSHKGLCARCMIASCPVWNILFTHELCCRFTLLKIKHVNINNKKTPKFSLYFKMMKHFFLSLYKEHWLFPLSHYWSVLVHMGSENKIPWLSGFTTRYLFPVILEAGSPRTRWQPN